MAYEHREGSGSLFTNHKKEEGSSQPDYRGDAMVNGVLVEIAGWRKQGNGGTFLSLNIKPKQEREGQKAPEPQRSKPATLDDLDDSLPF
jgi:hypothetical protein